MSNLLNNLLEETKQKLNQIRTNSDLFLLRLFEKAIKGEPFLVLSISDYLSSISSSGVFLDNFIMASVGIYVFENKEHNYYYIGMSFNITDWLDEHYNTTFYPKVNSNFLSQNHAREIQNKKKKINDEIVAFPIVFFPSLLSLDPVSYQIIKNTLLIIENRLIYVCRWAKYKLYNNSVTLSSSTNLTSPNLPSNCSLIESKSENLIYEKELLELEIEECKLYVMEKIAKKICIPYPFEQWIGVFHTKLFHNFWNHYNWKPPHFFDKLIFDDWLKQKQFWIDFKNNYPNKLKEIKLYGETYIKSINKFNENEKKTLKTLIVLKTRSFEFSPAHVSNTYLGYVFSDFLKNFTQTKRTQVINFISSYIESDEYWNTIELQNKTDYLSSNFYSSLVNTMVNKFKAYALSQIENKKIKINKDENKMYLLENLFSWTNLNTYFIIPDIKHAIENWLNSKEFLENF